MISRTVLLSLFLVTCSLSTIYGFSGRTSKVHDLLPWELITEKFHEGSWFCGSSGLIKHNIEQGISDATVGTHFESGLCSKAGDSITVRFPEAIDLTGLPDSISVRLDRYSSNSWRKMADISLSARTVKGGVSQEISEEGFYRLTCPTNVQPEPSQNKVIYAIVCNNWKKDALSFCRKLKEDIELNSDTKLFMSCIAVSHFDHVMELISGTPVLTDRVLDAMGKAVDSRQVFKTGKCPDLVVGLNKIRLRRFPGSHVEEFVVFIPDNYTSSSPWPVNLETDNLRRAVFNKYANRTGLIDVWWHTVANKDIDWKSYQAMLGLLKRKLNIDEDRIYVHGTCGNGLAAMSLALKHPDHWAECGVALGNTYRHLAGNALNLQVLFARGTPARNQIGYYEFAVHCFKYFGCERMTASSAKTPAEIRGSSVPQISRTEKPPRVFYSLESLDSPRAYWVQIDGRIDENFLARLDARVRGHVIEVNTLNVDAYTLHLSEAPVDWTESVEIIENGKSAGRAQGLAYISRADKYKTATYIKTEYLHGPVWDVFTDAYAVIWGSNQGATHPLSPSERLARTLSGGAPCHRDNEAPVELIDSHHLVLIGRPDTNQWLKRVQKDLRLSIDPGGISLAGKRFDGRDVGVILIHPNPLNTTKYVVVLTGTSSNVVAHLEKAYEQLKSMGAADVGVFDVDGSGKIQWRVFEKLSTIWDWHESWDDVLGHVKAGYSPRQWRQWITWAIKDSLGADVALCDDAIRLREALPAGQITFRDLAKAFHNFWIVKIALDGRQLRQLFIVPPSAKMKSKTTTRTVCGIRLYPIGDPLQGSELNIAELDDRRRYTLACDYKCLNGGRVGLLFKDYEIVDEIHLLPMLRRYMEHHNSDDLDAQISRLSPRIFLSAIMRH